jgi:tetratricopeptide (TPR) repeat protein
MLLLVGGEGVGKSTLLREVVKWEHKRGILVLEGRAVPTETPQPYSLLLEAVRSLPTNRAGTEDKKSLSRDLGLVGLGIRQSSWHGRISPTPLPLLAFTPSVKSKEEREAHLLEALSEGKGHVEQRRRELFDGLASYLEDLGTDNQLMLALEDIHLGDAESLDFLDYFARRMGERHIRLVATALPTPRQPPEVRTLVEALVKEGLLSTLEVRPLTVSETMSYIALLAPGRSFSDAVISQWHSVTEGNPLLLERLVREELAHPGVAAAMPRRIAGKPSAAEVPLVLQSQVRKVREDERQVLVYSSVLGNHFPFALLHEYSGEDEDHLSEVVDSLIHRGILRETGEEYLDFVDDGIRREVYGTLDPARRRQLHQKAAETLEAHDIAGPQRIYELAQHWYVAGVDEKSLDYNLRAADLAKAAQAPEVAMIHLERALEVFPRLHPQDPAGLVSLVADLALQLDGAGEVNRGVSLLTSNLEAAKRASGSFPPREMARLELFMGRLLIHTGELQKAELHLEGAIEVLGKMEQEAVLLGNAHRLRGSVAFYSGDYPLAQEHYAVALPLLEKAGTPLDVARMRISIANVMSLQPDVPLSTVESLYLSAAKVLEEQGSPGEAALSLNNMGLVHMNAEDFADAIRLMEQALQTAAKGNDPRTMGWIECNLCDALIRDHKLQRAQEVNRKAQGHISKVGDKLGIISIHMNEGRILTELGDFVPAEAAILEAYRLAKAGALVPDEIEALLRLADIAARRGDAEAARKRLAEMDPAQMAKVRPDLAHDKEAVEKLIERLTSPSAKTQEPNKHP